MFGDEYNSDREREQRFLDREQKIALEKISKGIVLKLIMTKGLPGSGKSTWAKDLVNRGETKLNPAYKRINKDDLRTMLDNGRWSKANEKMILDIRDDLVTKALSAGFSVIVDDTNLHPKHEIRLREIAQEYKAEFEIKDFTDVPIEVCIEQDLKRFNSVGEAVIRRQYNQFLAPKIEPRQWVEGLPTAIMCDIDGTLALFGDANPYERDFSWDKVNFAVVSILEAITYKNSRSIPITRIILLSGRKDKFREATQNWLDTNGIPRTDLFMRKSDDNRPDFIIKEEIYRAEIEGKYNVLFVLDDRNQVVDLWRRLGLTCLQVAPGNF